MNRFDRRKYKPTVLNFRITEKSFEDSPLKIVQSYLQEKKTQEGKQIRHYNDYENIWNQFSFSRITVKDKHGFRVLSEDIRRKSPIISSAGLNQKRKFEKPRILKTIKTEKSEDEQSLIGKLRNINVVSLKFFPKFKTSEETQIPKTLSSKNHIPLNQRSSKNFLKTDYSPDLSNKISSLYKILKLKPRFS